MLNVKQFRMERGLPAKQIVSVMKEQYPKYDKALHSKVERPEQYGIRLVSGAEKLLEAAFAGTAPAARKREKRRLPQRLQCRVSKRDYRRLQLALKADGFDTMQSGLAHIIHAYLERRGKHGSV